MADVDSLHAMNSTNVSSQRDYHESPYMSETDDVTLCDNLEKPLIGSDEKPEEESISEIDAMMHILKANIGTGILAMPIAVKHAGLWFGMFGIFFIGMIAAHNMHLLVNARKRIRHKHGQICADYGQVMAGAVNFGPVPLRRFSSSFSFVADIFLIITQLGFCIVYILFVAMNLKRVVDVVMGLQTATIVYQASLLVLLIPYVVVVDLTTLAPFSSLANFLTIISLVLILVACWSHFPPISSVAAFSSWSQLPLFFGTAVYAFEGIGLVLPVGYSMRQPQHFGGTFGVLTTSMVLVTVAYSSVGFYGYLHKGNSVSASITLDLPIDKWYYLSVPALLAISVFISFALQFHVAFEIIRTWIQHRFPENHVKLCSNCLKTFLVLMCFLFSIAIPHLELMIALVGALSSTAIALIFPPLIDILITWPESGYRHIYFFKNVSIFIFGFVGFIVGTFTALVNIINVYGPKHIALN